MKKRKSGLSILEVVIFVLLISILFVALARLSTNSLKSSQISARQVLATHYSGELQNWLKGEKEENWTNFVTKAGYPTGLIYCVNTIPASIDNLVSSTGCGSTYAIDSIFKRDLTLTRNESGTEVNVNIVTTWLEGTNANTAPVNTVFTQWE